MLLIVKYGHIANSIHTMCRGTHSAGYVYHAFDREAECRAMFICEDFAVAEVLMEMETSELKKEIDLYFAKTAE